VTSLYAFPLFVGQLSIGSIALYSAAACELSGADLAGMSRLATIVSGTLLRRALDRLEVVGSEAPDEPYSRREVHQATGMVAAETGSTWTTPSCFSAATLTRRAAPSATSLRT
jgi:hypothetical protein